MTPPATARVRRPAAAVAAPSTAPPDTPPRAALVLYVSVPEGGDQPAPGPGDLAEAAEMLRELAQDLLPTARASVALSLVPGTSGDVRRIGDRISHLRLLAPPEGDEPGAAAPAPPTDVLSGSGDAR